MHNVVIPIKSDFNENYNRYYQVILEHINNAQIL